MGEMMAALNSSAPGRTTTSDRSHDRTARKFSLEVVSGQTRFPTRPLPSGRLSIGSGRKCWLQLGGKRMPEIHSWFEVGNKDVALYVFEEQPSVQVNGARVQFFLLKGGESIQIGPFEFLLHVEDEETTSRPHFNPPHLSDRQLRNLQSELAPEDEELSASELIDLLDEEMKNVERHESHERAGLHRLLTAVREQQTQLESTATEKPDVNDSQEWKECLTRLDQISRSLDERAERLKSQEREQADSASKLLEMQQQMLTQLDHLIAALDRVEEQPLRKASA